MSKQHRLFLSCGLFFVSALALWLGFAVSRAYANVTLVNFTATSKTGLNEVYVYWETSTEMDTVGFFVTRKDTLDGSFSLVSDFIPHEDTSGLIGAQYYFTDTDPALNLNQTYYYELEEITPNDPVTHGPVTVTVGRSATVLPPATNTPTATPTSTPTTTPSPSATPTTQQTVAPAKATAVPTRLEVTPRVATGATITPQPILPSSSSSPVVEAAAPTSAAPTSALPLAVAQLPTSAATAVPLALDAATVAAVAPPDAVARPTQQQAPAPTLASTEAAPAMAAPIVVATEAAPVAATTDSTSTATPLLVVAAFLFLGLAFVILRQVRQ